MTNPSEAALIAALSGEKETVLKLQHRRIDEEIAERREIDRQNLAEIAEEKKEVREEMLKLDPENEMTGDGGDRRKDRITLERDKLMLSKEERDEKRACWTDTQNLKREDREVEKALVQQDQRRKRIDELI
ncbi:MAG TPA: hypothetical protein VF824_10605 [Thermoanaerobaculia bacterium]|jgi:hypothetical protein